MDHLPSAIADHAKWLVWNVSWSVGSRRFECDDPDAYMITADAHMDEIGLALPECCELVQSLKRLACDASLHTANIRKEVQDNEKASRCEEHVADMKSSSHWSLKLVSHLHDLCWSAAWHVANVLSGFDGDADTNLVGFEKSAWAIAERSPSDFAQLYSDLVTSANALVEARDAQIMWLESLINDIEQHETGIRAAKTATTVGSIAGTMMLFTPAAPAGIAVLAASGAGALTTSIGEIVATKINDGSIEEVSKQEQSKELNFRMNIAKFSQMAEDIRSLSGVSEAEGAAVLVAILRGLKCLGAEAHRVCQSLDFIAKVVLALRAGSSLKTAADVALKTSEVIESITTGSPAMAVGIVDVKEGADLAGKFVVPGDTLARAGVSITFKFAISLSGLTVVASAISIHDCINSWSTSSPTKQGAVDLHKKFVEHRKILRGVLELLHED